MRCRSTSQRGASLVEMAIILPTLLISVLGIWQSALVFHARSHLNHATLEAARAGSLAHADTGSMMRGFSKGLVAYYGGGLSTAELAQRLAQVESDVAGAARVEILSPVIESFDDYQSPAVRERLNVNARAIPNLGIGYLRCPHDRPGCNANPQTNASGQTLSDANLLKLRITYGIPQRKQLPLVGRFYTWALGAVGAGTGDAFKQTLIDNGRIPLVTHVTLRMQSEPIEQTAMISAPGPGNNGHPRDPGTTQPPGGTPGGGGDPPGGGAGGGGGDSGGGCTDAGDIVENVSADVLFEFDSATLTPQGRRQLDQMLQQARQRQFDALELIGHTDALGDDAHNDRLSRRRAAAVRDYLRNNGFPPDRRIDVEGRGEREPVVPLSQCEPGPARSACLAPNRRVTFVWRG